jgi:tetratricopeptide (TPR) repeat protein
LAVLACSLGRDSQEDVDSLLASPEKNRGKAAFFIGRTMKLASLKAEGRCQVLTLEDIDQLLENYMQAYSRDPMATQGYYVGKAYLQLVRGDYASFTREADEALAIWPNRELVLGLCWQIYELGKAADACGCFSAYEEIFDDAVNKKNHSYLRSAVGYNQALRNDFMLKKEQACSLEKSEEQ